MAKFRQIWSHCLRMCERGWERSRKGIRWLLQKVGKCKTEEKSICSKSSSSSSAGDTEIETQFCEIRVEKKERLIRLGDLIVCVFSLEMGQSRSLFVYFGSVLIIISVIQIEKSKDGVLGIWTWGRKMVGADETTELWRVVMSIGNI